MNRAGLLTGYTGKELIKEFVYVVIFIDRGNEAVDAVQYEGSSVNERHLNSLHVNSIITSADDRFICVRDLGTNQMVINEIDRTTGGFSPAVRNYLYLIS